MNTNPEGAGWMARCDCGWERYETRRPALDVAIHKHACPKPKPDRTHPARRASASSWNDRKDSTWIDKM